MDDELKQKSVEFLSGMLDWADGLTTMAEQEIPQVLEEMLLWAKVGNSIWLVLFVFMSIVFFWLSWKFHRALKRTSDHFDAANIATARFCFGFAGVITMALAGVSLSMLIKVTVAPKLFLIQSIMGMMP